MAGNQMLQEVYENFSNLGKKYPTIKPYLTKCFTDIKAQSVSEQASLNQDKKEKIKNLLKKFMDMKHLEMNYEGLINETASNEEDLKQILKKLTEAILAYKKKTAYFASRQGKLLRDGKIFLSRSKYENIRQSCGFSTRYANFLIALNDLFEKYPRLCYCAIPIRTFMSNMKIIREICEENEFFWQNLF